MLSHELIFSHKHTTFRTTGTREDIRSKTSQLMSELSITPAPVYPRREVIRGRAKGGSELPPNARVCSPRWKKDSPESLRCKESGGGAICCGWG